MNAADSQRLLQHIRRLAGDPPGAATDGELLQRYLISREEAAFAALVRRHGAMVFAVCQSVLRQRQDAEDGFQAAFLILARKAGSIHRHEGLGAWLQRVAYRVALKARADNLRRQLCEAKTVRAIVAEPSSDDLSWGEMRAILHEELAALPERFRAPLVLCYLEGLTQEEAARQLGWSAATVKGRLQRGREKLRRRLERRGIALTAALGAALTGQALAETAMRSGGVLTMKNATTVATTLAREFLRPLPLTLVMLSGLMLSMGVGIGGLALHSPPTEPRPLGSGGSDRSLTVAAPKEAVDVHGDPLPNGAVARLGTIRFNHGQGLRHLLFSPDGKTIYSQGDGWLRMWDAATGAERGCLASGEHFLTSLVRTPDGKQIISLNQGVNDVVHVWDLTRMKEIRKLTLPVQRLESSLTRRNALSPDGRLAALNLPAEMRIFDLTTGRELHKLAKGGKNINDVVFAGNNRLVTADAQQTIDVWEARTGKLLRRFPHSAPAQVLAASEDGRRLATLEHHTYAIDRLLDKDVVRVWDLETGTQKHTLAARPKRWFMSVYFSPDGKRMLASSVGPERYELTIWDTKTGERIREMDDAYGSSIAVSPDGSRLASGNLPGKFELWDVKTGRRLSSLDSRHARAAALAFTPSNDHIVLLGFWSLSTWEIATGRRKEVFDLPHHSSSHPIPALSPDGKYALSFSGDWEKYQGFLWDVVQRRRLRTLKTPCAMGLFPRFLFAGDLGDGESSGHSYIRCGHWPRGALLARPECSLAIFILFR
jgi:RNA polymerase sigma factor (sigma-70 family)